MPCQFCTNNATIIDYKDTELLKKYIDQYARISRKRTSGVCSKHQRKLATAIKYARHMALLPFVAS
ncbi:MAG: 30S ribosomal protein S18 [Patescibacteria group bacterium]